MLFLFAGVTPFTLVLLVTLETFSRDASALEPAALVLGWILALDFVEYTSSVHELEAGEREDECVESVLELEGAVSISGVYDATGGEG